MARGKVSYSIAKVMRNIERNSIKDGECIRFKGCHSSGYGIVKFNGKPEKVHRLSEHFYHDLDLSSSLMALHKTICRFRDCWNPDHLYSGTDKDNARDSINVGNHPSAVNRNKETCSNGHKLIGTNVYVSPQGKRDCLICKKLRTEKSKLKLKEGSKIS